jgi:hypothetical protein
MSKCSSLLFLSTYGLVSINLVWQLLCVTFLFPLVNIFYRTFFFAMTLIILYVQKIGVLTVFTSFLREFKFIKCIKLIMNQTG